MRKTGLWGLIIVVVLITGGYLVIQELVPGPEAVIEDFEEALERADIFSAIECFDSVTEKSTQAAIKISSQLGGAFVDKLFGVDWDLDFAEYIKLTPFLTGFTDEKFLEYHIDVLSVRYSGGVYDIVQKIFPVENSKFGKILADSATMDLLATIDGDIERGNILFKREKGKGWVIDVYRMNQMNK